MPLHLARHYHASAAAVALPNPSLTAAAVRRVQEYVEAHLDQPLGIDDLAAVAALSPFHFSRVFKEAAGCSPRQYVIQRRVEGVRQGVVAALLSQALALDAAGGEIELSFAHCADAGEQSARRLAAIGA